MKYTVSLLLLVAISHAAGTTKQEEDDNNAAKRELLEGNYGLRIQPSVLDNALHSTEPQIDSNRNDQPKNIPSQDYGPPRAPQPEYNPVAKISDVLTGQGPSFPAAIAGHLYSPVSIYQPRLGSPTTFEISHPVQSQLRYSEHKIFNDNFQQTFQQNFDSQKQPPPYAITQQQNYERQENLKSTNQNFDLRPFNPGQPVITAQGENYEKQENLIQKLEPQKNFQNINPGAEATRDTNTKQQKILGKQNNLENLQNIEQPQAEQQEQQQTLQENFPTLTQLEPPRLDISEPLLPHLEPLQPQSRPIYSEHIIQQIFPQLEGFPQDFFQQINQLENQLTYNENLQETIHYIQNPGDEQTNRQVEKGNEQKLEEQNVSQQVQSSTERLGSASQTQSSSFTPNQNTETQAVSYARFSQGLPLPSNEIRGPPHQTLLQPLPSPSPLPQFQQLPKLQPPQLFQSLSQLPVQPIRQATTQQQLQPLALQPSFQPLPPQPTVQPSVAPLQPLFVVPNQSGQRIGIIRIRQKTNQLPQNQQTLTTRQPQFPSLTQNQQIFSTRSQNQQTLNTQQAQLPSTAQSVTSLNLQPTFVSQDSKTTNEISIESTTVFPRSTSVSSSQSTENYTTSNPASIVPKFVSTLPTKNTVPYLKSQPTSPPQTLFTSTSPLSTISLQTITEAPLSTILTSIPPLTTFTSVSQPQPTLAPVQTSEYQQIQQSTQAQILPTQQPVQVLTSLQPLPTEQTYPVTPQPLAIIEPISTAQPQPQQAIPGIKAIPVQLYQTINEYQPLIQVKQIDQQQPLQLVQVQPAYPFQIQLQGNVSPPSQQLQTQFTQQLDQQQHSQRQSEQQQQSQSQSDQQQQSQSLSEQQQQSQYQSEQQQQSQSLSEQQQQSQYQSEQQQQPQSLSEQQQQSQQSQYQSEKQQQSLSESEQQQQSQYQSSNRQQSQSWSEQHQQSQSEHEKEAAIAHAQELLYDLYTPFLQRPLYSEEQEIVIQQPHLKVASLAFPASYSSSFPAFHDTAAVSSTQYFGKYAQDIFGGHPHYHHYKKK